MSDAWIIFWEVLAAFGFLLVIIGVVLERAELIVKWGEREGFRKWIGKRIGASNERGLASIVREVIPHVLWVETLGFAILVSGLAVGFTMQSVTMALQGKENARLI